MTINATPRGPEPKLAHPSFVSAAALAEREPQPREWVVHDLVPLKQVTLLYGDGGVGKSLLALQLAMAAVSGRSWLGRSVRPGPVLYWTAEDDEEELHRRLFEAGRVDDVDLRALGNLGLRSLTDADAEIARADGPEVKPTDLYNELVEAVNWLKPGLVILDTLAEMFAVDEINRGLAVRSIKLLRKIAIRSDCAFLVLAHPSVTGMASGRGASGSTGWSNAVRSRLYMSRVTQKDGAEPDADARVLRTMKSNYGPTGAALPLRFDGGAFVPVVEDRTCLAAEAARADAVFLKLLREYEAEGRKVRETTGIGYAPTEFANSGRADGLTREAFHGAMQRLFQRGVIRVEEYGPPSKRRRQIVEVPR